MTKEFEALVSTSEEKVESPRETSQDASYPFPQQPTTIPAVPSPSAPPTSAEFPDQEEEDPSRIQTPSLPTFLDDDDTPTNNEEAPSSTTTTTIDHQPFVINPSTHLPPSHQTASLPTPSFHPPSEPPAFPSAVFPPPPPPPAQPQLVEPTSTNGRVVVESMDPLEISKIQKHAKWAISALNYEDFETARKELKEALRMLGG